MDLDNRPTPEELATALAWGARMACHKRHRERPIEGSYESMMDAVIEKAAPKMARFRHGGKKTLREYAYLCCCYALADLQRSEMRRSREEQSLEVTEELSIVAARGAGKARS